MALFFEQIMALPTVVYTALFALVLAYWLFVIFGALDLDMFDGGAEAGAESAAEGAAEAAADVGAEGAAETVQGLHEGFSLLSFMTWLGLRKAPFTVVFSLLVIVAWAASYLGMRWVSPYLGDGWLVGLLVGIGAFAIAMPITGLVSQPLGPLFQIRAAEGRRDLIGRTCVIETGSVDEGFGVATVEEDGRWPRIEVRASVPNELTRGGEALIVNYDPVSETFRVEALGPGTRSRTG